MKSSEINLRDYLQSLGSPHEWIIANRNGQATIINAFSFDQFCPFRLLLDHHRKQCKEFELRQHYALPNTPKIIILPNANNSPQDMLLLAQRGQFEFQKLVAHFQNQPKNQLQLVLQIVVTAQMLQKKYGYFTFTPEMIRASKGPSLLIWISESQVSNQPQYPIGPVYPLFLEEKDNLNDKRNNPLEMMLHSLLQTIYSKIPNNSPLVQIKKQLYENLTFEDIKKQIALLIKDQSFSQCSILISNAEKYRRMTQEKRKKMPQFLLNRTNAKIMKKDKSNLEQSFNKKSNATCSNNTEKRQNFDNSIGGIKKLGITKYGRDKVRFDQNDRITLSMLLKNKSKEALHFESEVPASRQSITYTNDHLRFSGPASTQKINNQISKKQQKHAVRDSGKTVSTSYAQHLSINSSGKKFCRQNSPTNQQLSNSLTLLKKSEKKTTSGLCKNAIKNQQNKSMFYKQSNKMEVKESKIIQQHCQQNALQSQPPSGRSLRSPSILKNVLMEGSELILQSSASPGSQFFKDVDNLLYSGANLSRKMQQSYDKSMEVEFQKILFD